MLLVVICITIPSIMFVLNSILHPPAPEPLNLDEAPAEIRALKDDLKDVLSDETFSWDYMMTSVPFPSM